MYDMTQADIDRFLCKFDITGSDDCWIWNKSVNQYGYGKFSLNRHIVLAHRISYEVFIQDITDELKVLHKCDNPPCCNPEHLFLGTVADNNLDKTIKRAGGGFYQLEENLEIALREYENTYLSFRKIGEMYGISESYLARLYRDPTVRPDVKRPRRSEGN